MNLYLVRRLFDTFYLRRFLYTTCDCKVFGMDRLPSRGPALLVSNHESLIDALVIELLYPPSSLSFMRPTGARDFFQRSRIAYWAARDVMRMRFLDRGSGKEGKGGVDVFREFRVPLQEGNILIYFPQGTRREGAQFLPGVFHLTRTFPDVPVIPILLRGTRGMFPPGAKWVRPYPVSVYIGEEFISFASSAREYAAELQEYVYSLDGNLGT